MLGNKIILDQLLAAKPLLNQQNKLNMSPLMLAIDEGNVDVVDNLLRAGASTGIIYNHNFIVQAKKFDEVNFEKEITALEFALTKKNFSIVVILLIHQASIKDQGVMQQFLLEQDQQDPRVNFCWGVLWENVGDFAKALDYFKKAAVNGISGSLRAEINKRMNEISLKPSSPEAVAAPRMGVFATKVTEKSLTNLSKLPTMKSG
jgi:ankyrin repeat protein